MADVVRVDAFCDIRIRAEDSNGNTSEYTYKLLWCSNRSSVGAGAPQTIAAGDAPWATTIGDVTGDGYQDIVCANCKSSTITVSYGSAAGHTAPQTMAAGGWPCSITTGDVTGDGYQDIVCANYTSNAITISCGDTACRGRHTIADTGSGAFTLGLNDVRVLFPQGSFATPREVTLWLSATSIRIPHPGMSTTTPMPVPASFPWDLMGFDMELEAGASAEMTLPFMPNVADARIASAEFRLYRFGCGADRFDPRDDVVEIVATTEDSTLVIDPVKRTATTTGAGTITQFGKYQFRFPDPYP